MCVNSSREVWRFTVMAYLEGDFFLVYPEANDWLIDSVFFISPKNQEQG